MPQKKISDREKEAAEFVQREIDTMQYYKHSPRTPKIPLAKKFISLVKKNIFPIVYALLVLIIMWLVKNQKTANIILTWSIPSYFIILFLIKIVLSFVQVNKTVAKAIQNTHSFEHGDILINSGKNKKGSNMTKRLKKLLTILTVLFSFITLEFFVLGIAGLTGSMTENNEPTFGFFAIVPFGAFPLIVCIMALVIKRKEQKRILVPKRSKQVVKAILQFCVAISLLLVSFIIIGLSVMTFNFTKTFIFPELANVNLEDDTRGVGFINGVPIPLSGTLVNLLCVGSIVGIFLYLIYLAFKAVSKSFLSWIKSPFLIVRDDF